MEVEFAGFRVTADGVKPSRQILDNRTDYTQNSEMIVWINRTGLLVLLNWGHYDQL